MTGDLELFLRGLFVNRWKCRHRRVSDVLDERVDRRLTCLDCHQSWSLADLANLTPRERTELFGGVVMQMVSTPVSESHQWLKDRFVRP